MRITKTAVAGTLESSDVLITVEPYDRSLPTENPFQIEIEGATAIRFGTQIRSVVQETLNAFAVESCRVRLQDKGALDCTIRARLSAALLRSSDDPVPVVWEALK